MRGRWNCVKTMAKHKRLQAYHFGLSAEEAAARWLRLKGYVILARRLRNAFGEIDLLVMKGNTLVIVEVKARRNFRDCLEAVTPMQQQRLIRAATALMAYPGKFAGRITPGRTTIRFDLVMIVPWRLPRHLKDAWRE